MISILLCVSEHIRIQHWKNTRGTSFFREEDLHCHVKDILFEFIYVFPNQLFIFFLFLPPSFLCIFLSPSPFPPTLLYKWRKKTLLSSLWNATRSLCSIRKQMTWNCFMQSFSCACCTDSMSMNQNFTIHSNVSCYCFEHCG